MAIARLLSCVVVAGVSLTPLSALLAAEPSQDAAASEEAHEGIQVGKPAPAFSEPDQDEKTVTLADFKGKWLVVYFYPKDMTSGCTTQACEFTEGIEKFNDMNATVIGVSADSAESHRKFIEKENLKISLLADTDKTMMKAYEAYQEKDGKGRIVRSTVIVDPEGNVAFHYPSVSPKGHADAVRAKLTELAEARSDHADEEPAE